MYHSVIVFLIRLPICEPYLGSDRQISMSDFEEDYRAENHDHSCGRYYELSVFISHYGYVCGNQVKLETYAVSYYLYYCLMTSV